MTVVKNYRHAEKMSNTLKVSTLQSLENGRIPAELITRNCATDFYGDEILKERHKFDAAYFATVREGGYSIVWLRGQLRDLVTFEEAPHWDNENAKRVAALNQIIAEGLKAGVKVFLYINEPKGFFEHDPIFQKYPDLKGPFNPLSLHPLASNFEPTHAFCTQNDFADIYLTGGFRKLFTECPDLAGIIMITASEILSHCFSNVDEQNLLNEDFKHRVVQCPRCAQTTSIATVIDVIEKIRKGVRQASATAKVVAWNWSWGMYEQSPQRSIISGLSEDITILCDMQRGGSKTVEDIPLVVDEYSFSYLGPSPLFIDTASLAEETGHELWAKIMVNVTHEFLVVPYLPLPFRLSKKMISVRDLGATGLMACWNYGGDTSTWMAQLASRIFRNPGFGTDAIVPEVRRLAEEIYGTTRAKAAYSAWEEFDAAFEYFPFDLFLIYYGPHMHGTGFEWVFTPEEIRMPWYFQNESGRRGTKLSEWCGRLSPEQIIHLLRKLTDRWAKGVRLLADSFGVANPFDEIPNFPDLVGEPGFEDFNISRTVYLHFLSTIAFIEFRLATLAFFASPEEQEARRACIRDLMDAEKPRIRAMAQIVKVYRKIPFAEEAQKHLYTAEDLRKKLADMDQFTFEQGQVF
jgi:hypothetical protein